MAPIIGKLGDGMARVFVTGCDFFIKQLNVLTFPTPHDAAESVGYVISTAQSNPLDQTLRFTLAFDMDGIKDLFRR